jgi:DNA-binding PadR family transcriptional regulator
MRLTELENAVLGVIWRRGPCSAYVLKREFDTSPSSSWSASAGSIYPLVKKLSAAGLIDVQQKSWGTRTRATVTLSETGKDALHDWVATVPHRIGQPSPDPIRTRAFFLDVLPQEQRSHFLDEAEEVTRKAIDELRAAMTALHHPESRVDFLATSGAFFQLKARLRWIRYLRRCASTQVRSDTSLEGEAPQPADAAEHGPVQDALHPARDESRHTSG